MTSTPQLDTPEQVVAEMAWVAREARALVGSDDDVRRRELLARKAALRERIEGPAE